ncbi:MAG: FHA domain-containing protein [Myxococcota bacterium]
MTNGRDSAPERRSGDEPVPSGASIEVVQGFYEGLRIPLDRDWMVIGRGPTADVVLSEPTISRAHAAVGYEKGEFFVQDLGSTNGTGVNAQRQPRCVLCDGDEIQLGKLLFRFKQAA